MQHVGVSVGPVGNDGDRKVRDEGARFMCTVERKTRCR